MLLSKIKVAEWKMYSESQKWEMGHLNGQIDFTACSFSNLI